MKKFIAGAALAVAATFGHVALPPVEATHVGNCHWQVQSNFNPDRMYFECHDWPDGEAQGWFRGHFWKYHWEPWGKEYTHCATGWIHKSQAEVFEVIYGFASASDPHIEQQSPGLNPYFAYHHGSEPSGRARCWT